MNINDTFLYTKTLSTVHRVCRAQKKQAGERSWKIQGAAREAAQQCAKKARLGSDATPPKIRYAYLDQER